MCPCEFIENTQEKNRLNSDLYDPVGNPLMAKPSTRGHTQGVNAIGNEMDLRDFDHAKTDSPLAEPKCRNRPERVLITLGLSVHDREALWDAAAAKGLLAPGMRLSDVIDVIGPREDPAIVECIAMLAQPPSMPGCEFQSFDLEMVVPMQVRCPHPDLKAA